MSQETIDQIFTAAVSVFAQSSFDRAKMDDIARQAGVAKGTIYYHFSGKEELFVALMTNGMDKMTAFIRRQIEDRNEAADQMQGVVQAHVDYLLHHGTFAQLLLTEVWGSAERQHAFRAGIRSLISLIEEVLQRGEEEGSFRLFAKHDTAVAIFGAISVAVLQDIFHYQDCSTDEGESLEQRVLQLSKTLKSLIFNGLLRNN